VRIFGASRCMFASHFPVDRLLWSFSDLVNSMLTILSDLSPRERSAFFSGCAAEQYRLGSG
jgi:predicted TIM-barrel fold metal-dependent hydrolase